MATYRVVRGSFSIEDAFEGPRVQIAINVTGIKNCYRLKFRSRRGSTAMECWSIQQLRPNGKPSISTHAPPQEILDEHIPKARERAKVAVACRWSRFINQEFRLDVRREKNRGAQHTPLTPQFALPV